jgi:hypothetical protein
MLEWWNTRMGQKLITSDIPRIASALERIADSLEKKVELDNKINDELEAMLEEEEDENAK